MQGVALVGTTASGKSEVALAAAHRVKDMEIVSVDSMCVYRGMNLATAKPPAGARRDVRHHLIDLVDPSDEFTVFDFQLAARCALEDLESRDRLALLVGGTGLYLRAVIDDLALPGRWPETAEALEREATDADGLEGLYARLQALDPVSAARMRPENRRRIMRALEVTIGSGRPFSSYGEGLQLYPPCPYTLVGIPFDPVAVDARIDARVRGWMADGLLEEVRTLAGWPGGLSRTARQALGYRELLAHVEHDVPLDECVEAAVRRTKRFARRQWAWFRRDPRIRWVGEGESAEAVVIDALSSAHALVESR